jgi:hypothetical protein
MLNQGTCHMLNLLSILTSNVNSGLLLQWTDLIDKSKDVVSFSIIN